MSGVVDKAKRQDAADPSEQQSPRSDIAAPRLAANVGLCTRCGSCIGVCPKSNVVLTEPLGRCLPQIVDPRVCEGCPQPCVTACPGIEMDFDALSRHIFDMPYVEAGALGHHRALKIAYAAEPAVRAAAASGGVLTTAVSHLLDTGAVKAAVVLRMSPERPFAAEPFLARTPEEIQGAAQSKYSLSPVNVIFGKIQHEPGPLAFVGLPCQVHALRKLQIAGVEWARRFTYVFGPYCGNILHFDSVRFFMRKQGAHSLSDVRRLQYRAGEWPGSLRVDLAGGRCLELGKFHANYLIPFFICDRCLLCTDLANEFADLSGGDAWAPAYEERGEGFSIAVARTEQGHRLLNGLIEQEKLVVSDVSISDALTMHSHGIDLKKRGAFLRIARQRQQGKPVPWYGYELGGEIPAGRRRFEWLLGEIFGLCHGRLLRSAIRLVPDRVIGRAFQSFRTIWKARTKGTKRAGLEQLSYVPVPKHEPVPARLAERFDIRAVEAHWDTVAAKYEDCNEGFHDLHNQRFEVGVPLLQMDNAHRLLNVWSRDAGAIPFLRAAAHEAEIVNAELSAKMIEMAQRNAPGERFVKLGHLGSLPFADNFFDRVLSLETVEHAPSQEVFIAELLRVLRKGGRCVLSAPPRSAEVLLYLTDLFLTNHGEGPHSFPWPNRVVAIIENSGGVVEQVFPSLILPAGPRVLRRAIDGLARRNPFKTLFFQFGIRHFFVFRKI